MYEFFFFAPMCVHDDDDDEYGLFFCVPVSLGRLLYTLLLLLSSMRAFFRVFFPTYVYIYILCEYYDGLPHAHVWRRWHRRRRRRRRSHQPRFRLTTHNVFVNRIYPTCGCVRARVYNNNVSGRYIH